MINPLPKYLRPFYEPLVGGTMLELGNKKTGNVTYKSYFEAQGVEHTSVDWNGLDGALVYDLRKPLDLGTFDMVTNIGTSEHVSDQYGVWQNIHRACKLNGVVISHTPYPGDMEWHGEWYPRESFFREFADKNGYRIEMIEVVGNAPGRLLNVRLRKLVDWPFIMPKSSTMYHNEGVTV